MTQTEQEFFKEKCILITGGTGMIGRALGKSLSKLGAHVTTASLDLDKPSWAEDHIQTDLTNQENAESLILAADDKFQTHTQIVFHLGGMKANPKVTLEKPATFFTKLVRMNTNVLEACRLARIPHVVYTSSIGAYQESTEDLIETKAYEGTPMDSAPGLAKRMAEYQIQFYKKEYGLENFSILRLTNIFGSYDIFSGANSMFIPSLMTKVKQYREDNKPIEFWGEGTAIRDFLYVDDCVEGIMKAAIYGTKGEVVNIGSGSGTSVKEMIKLMKTVIGFEYTFNNDPRYNGAPRRVLNIEKAKELLKFTGASQPYRIHLRDTWNWFLHHKEQERVDYFQEKTYA